MAGPLSFSAVTALTLAGASLGVYLGKSVISEINPAYFRSPLSASSFHADLVANTPEFSNPQLSPPQFVDATTAYGGACIGCRSYPVEYVPVHDSAVDAVGASYTAAVVASDVRAIEDEVEKAVREAQRGMIERYAHYPVSAEEARTRLASAEPEAVSAEPEEAPEEETAPGI